MDLGCYVLDAARQLGRWLDQAPSVVSAEASLREPEVDSAMSVEVAYAGGVRGRLRWDMNAVAREMVWTVVGTAGTAVVPAFAVPQMDNRIVVTRDGSMCRPERHGHCSEKIEASSQKSRLQADCASHAKAKASRRGSTPASIIP